MKTRHLPLFCALCVLAAGQAAFCQVESLITVPGYLPLVVDVVADTSTSPVGATAVTTGGIPNQVQVPSTSYNDGETIYVEEIVPAGFMDPVVGATQMVPELSLLGGAPSPQVESAMRWVGDNSNFFFQQFQFFFPKNPFRDLEDLVAGIDSLAAEGEGADETETEEGPSIAILRPQGNVNSESWETYFAFKIFADILRNDLINLANG
mmetsp:Transcript_13622/g.35148  ORF Transcript_13622/g.35148 Transcript_13622/m.35148 type:complete len:208 (+) Transcript_13622:198-821(+)